MTDSSSPCATIPDALWENMKEYGSRARAIAENGMLQKGIRHPWATQEQSVDSKAQAPEINSRVQVFEFEGNHMERVGQSDNRIGNLDLIQSWEDNDHANDSKINRRLFIVENMDPRVLELLGVKLEIPPEVFLARCDHLINLNVLDSQWERQSRSTYWRVAMPQVRGFGGQPRPSSGSYWVETGGIDRYPVDIMSRTGWVWFFSEVSCWATRYGKNNQSWTVVLLVDAHEVWLHSHKTQERVRLKDIYPPQPIYAEAVMGRENRTLMRPYTRPLYDAIVGAHVSSKELTGSLGPVTNDSFSATTLSRRLIHAAWAEFLYRRDTNVRDDVLDDEIAHRMYHGDVAINALEGVDRRTVQKYHQLIEVRNEVKLYKSNLNNLMWSFQARYPASGKEDEDQRSWDRLEETLTVLEGVIAEHMEMFAQRATMEESFAAKRQARSAGQLTIIATVAVPCTFVASVFSMGGKFAAGESLFGVYWAISIPATVVLLAWVLFATSPKLQQLKYQLTSWRRWRLPKLLPWRKTSTGAVDEEKGEKSQ